MTTTPSTLESRKAGINWDEIALTIQDAISVTRDLGLRYLWVDALCIIQGPGGDWDTESRKMADVYGGAFLTLSAALNPRVQYGLRLIRGTFREQNPLFGRARSFQERGISRRTLTFFTNDLAWQCCEQMHSPPEWEAPTARRLINEPDNYWRTIVGLYSFGSLTRETDRLPALSGLAAICHDISTKDYLAGLWKQSLLLGLLWADNINEYREAAYVSSVYIAPS